MSQPPRNKPPIRQVPTSGGRSGGSSGGSGNPANNPYSDRSNQPSGGYYPPPNRGGNPPNRSNTGGGRGNPGPGYGRGGGNYGGSYGRDYGPPPPRDYRNMRPRNVPPPSSRDPFPYIMGGLIGALIVGLGLVIFLLISNNKSNPVASVPPPSDTTVAGGASSAPTTSASDPPRMPMDQFKALYDNPAKRPIIIDVRAKETFDAGHIAGAISFPEADVPTRYAELPKDKLVVAYCQ